jgi:formamidopyrimidine-DNA glycosylase
MTNGIPHLHMICDCVEKNTETHYQSDRKTGEKCEKKNCKGIIQRKIVNGRRAHFCSNHQK